MFPFPSPTPKRRPSRLQTVQTTQTLQTEYLLFPFLQPNLNFTKHDVHKHDRVLLLFTKKKGNKKYFNCTVCTVFAVCSLQSSCFGVTTFPCTLRNINYLEVHFVSQKLKINQWYNRGPVYTTPNQAVINWHGLKLS